MAVVDAHSRRQAALDAIAAIAKGARADGKLRARQGTDCVELDGDRARAFLERRRSYVETRFARARAGRRASAGRGAGPVDSAG